MTSLLDIAPELARETVMVSGKPLELQAITMLEFAALLRRFPDLIGGLSGDDAVRNLEIIPAVIAAGVGHCGDATHESAAARLPVSDQVIIAGIIMRLSMPEDAGGPLGDASGSAIVQPLPTVQANGSQESQRS